MTIDAELPLSLPLAPPPPHVETVAAPGPSTPRFGALKALIAFFLLLFAQLSAGIFVMLVALLSGVARGKDVANSSVVSGLITDAMPALLFASGAFSTAAVLAIARAWAWPAVLDRSAEGIGLNRAQPRAIALWAIAGTVISALYMSGVQWLVPPDPSTPAGPLAQAAASGGLNRVMWIVLALLFAPLVEEFFFRGVLLKGFTNSWGLWPGAIVTTILFVLLHLMETIHYWPATVAVTAMAIAVFVARKTTGSLVPPIAMHFSYNLTIVLFSTGISMFG
ncbi:MAG TPA: CPBP family glutamic-type intramembrane protease [Thermoanaerobaculia bacterium]|nr:CPBP family glutamic-type intramembrane protease [Thermoanaerobaculia bacterium]